MTYHGNVSEALTKGEFPALCRLNESGYKPVCPNQFFSKELNVNRLLFALLGLMSLTTAQAANFTRFQSYEAAPGAIDDVQVFEVSASDLRHRVYSFQIDGQKWELGEVRLTRTSDKYDIRFEAAVTFSTETGPAPAPVTTGRLTKISPIPKLTGKVTIEKRLEFGDTLSATPCALPVGCQSQPFTFKEWTVKAAPELQAKGIEGYYYARSLRLKSIDYDWATGEWTRLVFTETLFTSMRPMNIPNGGMTVGNGPH